MPGMVVDTIVVAHTVLPLPRLGPLGVASVAVFRRTCSGDRRDLSRRRRCLILHTIAN